MSTALIRRSIQNNIFNKINTFKVYPYSSTRKNLENEKIKAEQWSTNKRICQIDLGNGITNVKLSRETKLNSLDMEMFRDIVSVAQSLKKDKSIRVIILSGEGRAFCTGLDLVSVFF